MTAAKQGSALRRVGIGLLGFIGGLLSGLIIQNLLAVAFLPASGNPPVAFGLVLGYLLPVVAVVGVFVALAIDANWTRRHRTGHKDD